jgi:hypothetical protein
MSATQRSLSLALEGKLSLVYPQGQPTYLVMFDTRMAAICLDSISPSPSIERLIDHLANSVWLCLQRADPTLYTVVVDGNPHKQVPIGVQPPAVEKYLKICCQLANRHWNSRDFAVEGNPPISVPVSQMLASAEA